MTTKKKKKKPSLPHLPYPPKKEKKKKKKKKKQSRYHMIRYDLYLAFFSLWTARVSAPHKTHYWVRVTWKPPIARHPWPETHGIFHNVPTKAGAIIAPP
jgi:hypothetical protein